MLLKMRIVEIIEALVMDESVDLNKRSVYGSIRFIIGTRFKALDAAPMQRSQRSKLTRHKA